MFTLEHKGNDKACVRLIAPAQLTETDFRTVSAALGHHPVMARKIGLVSARPLAQAERIETRWNGRETENAGQPGDWVVTSLTATGQLLKDGEGHVNRYIVGSDSFEKLYEPSSGCTEYGANFAAKGRVEALRLPGGFEIMAPWGEIQRATDGYLLLNGTDVYGNNRETFEATYLVIG